MILKLMMIASFIPEAQMDVESNRSSGCKPRYRRVGSRSELQCILISAVVAMGCGCQGGKMQAALLDAKSKAFVERMQRLGRELSPGGTATFELQTEPMPPKVADTLLWLPAFVTKEQIAEDFPIVEKSTIAKLATMAADDRTAPALVWLYEGRIVASSVGNLGVGVNSKIVSWKVDDSIEITVTKEVSSPNGFLSLEFVPPKD